MRWSFLGGQSAVSPKEVAVSFTHACSPGHMPTPSGFSMLCTLVLLFYLILWVLVFEMVL